MRFAQPHVRPRLAGVGGLVHAVARVRTAGLVRLACSRPRRVFSSDGATSMAPIDSDGCASNTGSKVVPLFVGLPHPAVPRAHVERVEVRRERRLGHGDGRRPGAGPERAEIAPREALEERLVESRLLARRQDRGCHRDDKESQQCGTRVLHGTTSRRGADLGILPANRPASGWCRGAGQEPAAGPEAINARAAASCCSLPTSVRTSPACSTSSGEGCTAVSLSRVNATSVAPVRRRRSASIKAAAGNPRAFRHHGALDLEPGRESRPGGPPRDASPVAAWAAGLPA